MKRKKEALLSRSPPSLKKGASPEQKPIFAKSRAKKKFLGKFHFFDQRKCAHPSVKKKHPSRPFFFFLRLLAFLPLFFPPLPTAPCQKKTSHG